VLEAQPPSPTPAPTDNVKISRGADNPESESSRAVTVYCASSSGNEPAYREAALSVGRALASANRPLVYGGGTKGLMGLVSTAASEAGGAVTGVLPGAMLAAGGEGDKTASGADAHGAPVVLTDLKHANVQTIIVHSMHERKIEMARRACAFIGLPGGYGTFEELMEAITWTQLGIHSKPVILINTLGYYEPLRAMIQTAMNAGFIRAGGDELALFVDGPADHAEHASYDWGATAVELVENWAGAPAGFYKWS